MPHLPETETRDPSQESPRIIEREQKRVETFLQAVRRTLTPLVLSTGALVGGEKTLEASPAPNPYNKPYTADRVEDALTPPPPEKNLPPAAAFPETGEIFAELQAEQKQVVRAIILHFQQNQDKSQFAGMHLDMFEKLSREDNLPALLEVVNAYRQGWYNTKTNDRLAQERIEWAFKNMRMNNRQERGLQDQWLELETAKRKRAEYESRQPIPASLQTTPKTLIAPRQAPPPPIAPQDRQFLELEWNQRP